MQLPQLDWRWDFTKDGRLYNKLTHKYRKPYGLGLEAYYCEQGYNINIVRTLAKLFVPKMMSCYNTVVWTGEALHADCVYWVNATPQEHLLIPHVYHLRREGVLSIHQDDLCTLKAKFTQIHGVQP